MSDNKIKVIHNSLSNFVKKVKIYENIIELKKMSYGFFFVFTFTTTALIINSIYNSYTLYNLHKELYKIEEKYSEIITLLDKNMIFINEQSEVSSITLEKNQEKENNVYIHPEYIFDGDELVNECYDNIPCNNIKKITGLKKLFSF